jgi:hypothetical protein
VTPLRFAILTKLDLAQSTILLFYLYFFAVRGLFCLLHFTETDSTQKYVGKQEQDKPQHFLSKPSNQKAKAQTQKAQHQNHTTKT